MTAAEEPLPWASAKATIAAYEELVAKAELVQMAYQRCNYDGAMLTIEEIDAVLEWPEAQDGGYGALEVVWESFQFPVTLLLATEEEIEKWAADLRAAEEEQYRRESAERAQHAQEQERGLYLRLRAKYEGKA